MLCLAIPPRRQFADVRLTAGTVLEDVVGHWVLAVRIADGDVSCRGLCLGATEPEMLAKSIRDILAVLTWCGSICCGL